MKLNSLDFSYSYKKEQEEFEEKEAEFFKGKAPFEKTQTIKSASENLKNI